jgi:hypothetical protein
VVAGAKVRGHLLWRLMPAYTFGRRAFVPLTYAALRLRRTEVWLWAGGVIAITAAIVGTIQTARLRQELFEKRPPTV